MPARREARGRTGLPVVDAFLAATARAHQLVLVTRNVRDFAKAGVPLVNPFTAGS